MRDLSFLLSFLSSLFGRFQFLHQLGVELLHRGIGGFSRDNLDLANDITVFVKNLAVFIGDFACACLGVGIIRKLTDDLSLFVKDLALFVDFLALKNRKIWCES